MSEDERLRRSLYDAAHDALRGLPEWDDVGGMTWDDFLGDLAAHAVDAVLAEQAKQALDD